MKRLSYIQYIVAILLLSGAVFTLSSCGGSDEPSPIEKQQKLLAGTWTINSVKVDGVDYTNLFTGFTLTFTENPPRYSPTNGGKVWTTEEDLVFAGALGNAFVGPGSEIVSIETITANTLVLRMNWTTTTLGKGGRANSIAGNHEFTFTK
jgi:hypothetical protein